MVLPTRQDIIDTLNTFYGSTIYSDFNTVSLDKILIALAILNTQSTGGGGSGSSATEYAEGATTSPATGVVSLGRNSNSELRPIALNSSNQTIASIVNFPATQPVSATSLPLPSGASTESTLSALSAKLPSALVGGRLAIDGSGVTQPVSIATLPSLAAGSNAIGSVSVSNFPSTQAISAASLPLPSGAATESTLSTLSGKLPSALVGGRLSVDNSGVTQPISASSLPLPTGAATSAKQPALGTAGAASTDVITVQGIANGVSQPVDQQRNLATTTATFTSSTTSSTFTIANRLAVIVIPAITGAPTLTLQLTLDAGTTWVSTSVVITTNDSNASIIEADSLAKLSGAFGLTNAFRFNSSATISSATLNIRSIVQ